jgi:hypothetical protein
LLFATGINLDNQKISSIPKGKCMSHSHDVKKDVKKKAQKTLKEKRAEKKAKKEGR